MDNTEHLIIGWGQMILSTTMDNDIFRIILLIGSIYSFRQWYKGN